MKKLLERCNDEDLTTARDAAATFMEWTAKREASDKLEQATLDELTEAIGKRTSKERLQALARAYRFVHAAAQGTRAAERGFWRNKDASAMVLTSNEIIGTRNANEALHAAFRAWTARQIDKHTIIAEQVEKELRAATTGMTERECAWLALRIKETRLTKDGDPLYPSQREIGELMGIHKQTVKRIEDKQERRKEILALYRSLMIKPRIERGGRVTTGKNADKG